MPKTVTNEINRQKLREMGAAYSIQELAEIRARVGGPKRELKEAHGDTTSYFVEPYSKPQALASVTASYSSVAVQPRR